MVKYSKFGLMEQMEVMDTMAELMRKEKLIVKPITNGIKPLKLLESYNPMLLSLEMADLMFVG